MKWLVILSDNIPKKSTQSIIAHEFAHVYLNHTFIDDDIDNDQKEIDACLLAQKWGFKGEGANLGWLEELK